MYKEDLASNNQQSLMCYKTKPNICINACTSTDREGDREREREREIKHK